MERKKILVNGIVQGVGFRPAVYRIALKNGIAGNVINTSAGVVIEAEGKPAAVRKFLRDLKEQKPPQSRIDSISVRPVPAKEGSGFVIEKSRDAGKASSIVPADLSLCAGCRKDIFDKSGRRWLYPFTNCTNCGPRFTIVRSLPYDRPLTTMSRFRMCPDCLAEYENPSDRRFHAQPNACPVCGPEIYLDEGKRRLSGPEALKKASDELIKGKIASLQSLGGFHLACDAFNKAAVMKLRERKLRPHKPLAVMVRSIKQARKICFMNQDEADALSSQRAPIVMLKKKKNIPGWIAPGLADIGVMLPYTPLHEILFEMLSKAGFSGPLIMTSGNRIDEPICRSRDEAVERLSDIADLMLYHDREIHNRCDDSVAFVLDGTLHPVRRSRGFVPDCVKLAVSGETVLGCGADFKNTFCLTRGGEAFLSQHIGDLEDERAGKFYLEALARMKSFLGVTPAVVAHDLHPDYSSTSMASGFRGMKFPVQHHLAHIASVMAEHRLDEPVLGVALDGTGYGTDAAIWGSEFLKVDEKKWERLGHLKNFALPGGDAASA
ncbi:MAG: carbamoyltransferase HypF, partial [bacterium]